MNDFTKEELQSIIEGITWRLDGDEYLPSVKLIDKIQSMIDNYCEHQSTYEDSALMKFCNDCDWVGGIDDNQ